MNPHTGQMGWLDLIDLEINRTDIFTKGFVIWTQSEALNLRLPD